MDALEQQLTRFLKHLAHERRLSEHTVKAYEQDLLAFIRYLAQQIGRAHV